MNTSSRIRTRDAAAQWRDAQTGKVVFTNGVFDLLHPGHVELLEQAKRLGDLLVVGVNSHDSAARLAKGPGRPVTREADRARLIAALAAVDCVVIFDEDTPLDLIRALRPDVLVKGGDYTRSTIVGADLVEQLGGRVETIELVQGYSSSDLVERIRGTD